MTFFGLGLHKHHVVRQASIHESIAAVVQIRNRAVGYAGFMDVAAKRLLLILRFLVCCVFLLGKKCCRDVSHRIERCQSIIEI